MNMIKLVSTLFLLFCFIQIQAQDIDLYKKDQNDNYKLPQISKQMTHDQSLYPSLALTIQF